MNKVKELFGGGAAELVDSVGRNIDNLTESEEERQSALTERHRVDMASDNQLAKSIRPIALIYSMAAMTFVLAGSFYLNLQGKEFDAVIAAYVFGLGLGAFGFYFNSRRAEKINAKKADTALQIEEKKALASIELDKRAQRDRSKMLKRLSRKGIDVTEFISDEE